MSETTKELTVYQLSVIAERDDLAEKIAAKESFIGTDEWLGLGAEVHNHIVYELGSMRGLLATREELIKAFTAKPEEELPAIEHDGSDKA